MTACKTIILTGGGTAGHIWPHFSLFEGDKSSLAQAFHDNKLKVYYVGSRKGMEKDLVTSTQPSWIYCPIATGKLRRYFSIQNFFDLFSILLGFIQAFLLVRKVKPAVIFSKGGFVSVPVVWAAWMCRVPVVIHESDATPALGTKLSLPFCALALFAFAEAIKKTSVRYHKKSVAIGLPIRESLFTATKEEGLKYFSFSSARKTLLIFGGSLGAQRLNKKIFEILPALQEKYNIIHIVGKGNSSGNNTPYYRQFEFLKDDMRYAYAAADFAICRAGASSIFELAAARIPMLLIPLGLKASRGDQIVNAQIFMEHGWAQSIDEETLIKDVQGHALLRTLDQSMNTLSELKSSLDTAPTSSATQLVSELIHTILQQGFQDFSHTIAMLLKPGDWLFLEGDLGAGKTTLTQKISRSLGSQLTATSPTFSLLNAETLDSGLKFLHLDLYRIKSGQELCFLGLENEFDVHGSFAVFEWPYNVTNEEYQHFFKVTGCSKPVRILEVHIEYSEEEQSRIYSLRILRNNYL